MNPPDADNVADVVIHRKCMAQVIEIVSDTDIILTVFRAICGL